MYIYVSNLSIKNSFSVQIWCLSSGALFALKSFAFVDLMAKVNASPKKKVQAKLNTSGQLQSPPADLSVNVPRKFSGFIGKLSHLWSSSFSFVLKPLTEESKNTNIFLMLQNSINGSK